MKILICVTGMPGAGKSVIAEYISNVLRAPLISMGNAMREEALRRGKSLDLKSMMKFALEIRKELGKEAVARLVIKKLSGIREEIVVIDGVRSLEEIDYFSKHAKTLIVAVHASPRERFKRLRSRGRKDDPKTWEEFRDRDIKELTIGLGKVIALADVMVVNEFNEETNIKDVVLQRVRKALKNVRLKN